MGIVAIRQLIAEAINQEQRTGEIRGYFATRLPALRERLVLPEDNPLDALVEFTRRYIQYVPEFIETLHTASDGFIPPFLHMAEDFFLAPPQELAEDHGLQALLDEAFLAQRLLEEVNDRHILLRRAQLVPLDMTRANIIVHHLIGDELANQLDCLVEQSISRLLGAERLFEAVEDRCMEPSLEPVVQAQLPCMSREVAIDLRLAETGSGQLASSESPVSDSGSSSG